MRERSLHAKGAENDAASPAESAAPPSNFNHLMERQPTLGDLGFEDAPRTPPRALRPRIGTSPRSPTATASRAATSSASAAAGRRSAVASGSR